MESARCCSGLSTRHAFTRHSDQWHHLFSFIHNPTHSSRSSPTARCSTMTSTFASAPRTALPFSPALSFTFSTGEHNKADRQRPPPWNQYSLFGEHQYSVNDSYGGRHNESALRSRDERSNESGHDNSRHDTSYYPYFYYDDHEHCSMTAGEPSTMTALTSDPGNSLSSSPTKSDGRSTTPPPFKKHKSTKSFRSGGASSSAGIFHGRSVETPQQHYEQDGNIVPYSRTPSPSPCPSPPQSIAFSNKGNQRNADQLAFKVSSSSSSCSSSSYSSDTPMAEDSAELSDTNVSTKLEPTLSAKSSSSSSSSSSVLTATAETPLYQRRRPLPQVHVCPIPGCEKRFDRRFNLKVHIVTHDPQRAHQFECTVVGCGRRYTRKNDMERHVKSVHLGARLECSQCGFHFTRMENLRKHTCPNGPTFKAVMQSSASSSSSSSSCSTSKTKTAAAKPMTHGVKIPRYDTAADPRITSLVTAELEKYRKSVEINRRGVQPHGDAFGRSMSSQQHNQE